MDLSLRVKRPSKFSLLPPQSFPPSSPLLPPTTHCPGSQPHRSILCERSEKLNTKLMLQQNHFKHKWLNVKDQRKSPRITLQMWLEVISTDQCRPQLTRHSRIINTILKNQDGTLGFATLTISTHSNISWSSTDTGDQVTITLAVNLATSATLFELNFH